jgi:hypothetical protein
MKMIGIQMQKIYTNSLQMLYSYTSTTSLSSHVGTKEQTFSPSDWQVVEITIISQFTDVRRME